MWAGRVTFTATVSNDGNFLVSRQLTNIVKDETHGWDDGGPAAAVSCECSNKNIRKSLVSARCGHWPVSWPVSSVQCPVTDTSTATPRHTMFYMPEYVGDQLIISVSWTTLILASKWYNVWDNSLALPLLIRDAPIMHAPPSTNDSKALLLLAMNWISNWLLSVHFLSKSKL